jgi:glycosyltransferase involved in cell wall biosynthesis
MKRIALFAPGGIAPADSYLHIPALSQFVELLSTHCAVVVYSFAGESMFDTHAVLGEARVNYLSVEWNAPWVWRVSALVGAFRKDHSREKFDIIHGLWGSPAGVAAIISGKLANVPSVVSFLGGESADVPALRYGQLHNWKGRRLIRWVAGNASCIHLLTRFQAFQLHSRGIGFHHSVIIPFGTNTSLFTPNNRALPQAPYRLLHVGNLTEVKDQRTLLRSFQRITRRVPASLRIIGRDYLNGGLDRLIQELGLSSMVTCLGYIPHSEMKNHYHWADLLLHTSVHESEGVVVVEAMASGLPVVGTKVGLLHDLNGQCAVTVKPGDDSGLAEEALSLLRSPDRLTAIRLNGWEWAAANTMSHTVHRMLEVYEEISAH